LHFAFLYAPFIGDGTGIIYLVLLDEDLTTPLETEPILKAIQLHGILIPAKKEAFK
jgi:hypothetical protein